MVRRRHTFLLALSLVSVGILYVAFTQNTAAFSSLYPQLISADIKIHSVDVVPSKVVVTVASSQDKDCSSGTLMYGNYCVISPYDNELKNTTDDGLVTLCTQGTVEFLQHVVVLCHRWSGPISVAVYSPQDDYADARIMVQLLRQCDSCVRYWVNWHFFFLKQNMPAVDKLQLSRECSSVTQANRPKKRRSHGTYPINVGRNVARKLARTPFVFSTDIELYPSLNIPSKFERMLRSQAFSPDNQVWVFPVFEVHSKFRAPVLKSELRHMFAKKQAISFHQYRCNICHRIPNLTQWIAHGNENNSEMEDSFEPLKVWSTVKRSHRFKLHEWEPFFIGTTKDPEFDIRLSWEGKQNKMQMAYEMCMRNYDFHIIENAFLVHTPGINVYNASKEKDREKHYAQNRRVIATVRRDLIQKYGSKNDC